MVAKIGDDEAGNRMRSDLTAHGVDVSLVLMEPDTQTGSATICVDNNGENLIVVDAGANGALRPHEVTVPAVASADALLVQLEIPLATVTAAVEAANGLVILNPAPARRLPANLLAHVDILVPNQEELCLLAGAPRTDSLEDLGHLADDLDGSFDIVVTLGGQGALVANRRHEPRGVHHVPAPTVDAVDTTGAGDTFCGALSVALAEGQELLDAVRLAVAAASWSTTRQGARGALPARAEAEALSRGGAPCA
jgi:ribokinase